MNFVKIHINMETKNNAIHKFLENIVINNFELSIICGARVMKITGENLYVLRKSTTSILWISTLIPPNPKSDSYKSYYYFAYNK
jgi:hypothetical protein